MRRPKENDLESSNIKCMFRTQLVLLVLQELLDLCVKIGHNPNPILSLNQLTDSGTEDTAAMIKIITESESEVFIACHNEIGRLMLMYYIYTTRDKHFMDAFHDKSTHICTRTNDDRLLFIQGSLDFCPSAVIKNLTSNMYLLL